MGFAYFLHESFIFPHLSNAKRNCRIFLIAGWIYTCLYLFLVNWRMEFKDLGKFIFAIAMMDLFVCGCVYKDYYGRSILSETEDTNNNWHYDEKTHKYTPKPTEEKEYEAKQQLELFEKRLHAEQVMKNKERIRAAAVIQRWWHKKLYEPGCGILFLRGQEAFYKTC